MLHSLVLPGIQRFRHRQRIKRILDTARTSQELKLGLDPQVYLKKFLKREVLPDSIPLSTMRIDFLNAKTFPHFRYRRCACRYDAPLYFVLAYQDQNDDRGGLALLGFRVNAYRKTVFVDQIQGIRLYNIEGPYPQKEELMGKLRSFRWEKMLIKIAEDWAVLNNFSRIGIRQARFNQWLQRGKVLSDSELQHNERLRMHYDITARRMGYKTPWFWGWFRGYHYKKLSPN